MPRLCTGSSCVRTAGSSLLSGCVAGLELGTARDLHTALWVVSAFPRVWMRMSQNVCAGGAGRRVGARAPPARMVDGTMALIYRYSPSLLLCPAVVSWGHQGWVRGWRNSPAELWRWCCVGAYLYLPEMRWRYMDCSTAASMDSTSMPSVSKDWLQQGLNRQVSLWGFYPVSFLPKENC